MQLDAAGEKARLAGLEMQKAAIDVTVRELTNG
jgi:hypothetical protein